MSSLRSSPAAMGRFRSRVAKAGGALLSLERIAYFNLR
jgi:hypothetical protein